MASCVAVVCFIATAVVFSAASSEDAIVVCSGDTSHHCTTLEDAASNSTSDSVAIVIDSPRIFLSELVVFSNLNRVRIDGNFSIIDCAQNTSAGLFFDDVDNVVLSDITFVSCGGFNNYSAEENETRKQRSAVHAFNCTNITISGCSFHNNLGSGVAIVHNQGGSIEVLDSNFTNNSIPHEDIHAYAGGGGIFMRTWESTSTANSVLIRGCNFNSNRPTTPKEFVFVTSFGRTLKGTGRGGGVDIVLSGTSHQNFIEIENCDFTANAAFLGGGLAIQIQGEAQNNTAIISGSNFKDNGCRMVTGHQLAGSGGGLHFGYSLYSRLETHANGNSFLVRDSHFYENCAELGGGGTFFSSRSQFQALNNTMNFTSCTWDGNSARVGAAMDVSPHVFERLSKGFLPTVAYEDCRFVGNSVAFRTQHLHQAYGTGTLFSSLFDIVFTSSVHFENNSGSAFIIVNGIADFASCSAEFIGNTGIQGGAITLIGISSMLIGPGNTYNFIGNRASDLGGAIYSYLIDDHDFSVSRSCFIQYEEPIPNQITHPFDWNVTFTFDGNYAERYGHSIYTTSLIPCQRRLSSTENRSELYSAEEIFQWKGVFEYANAAESHIATEGARFEINGSLPFRIIPGEQHSLQVYILDDLNQTVEATFRASVLSSTDEVYVDDAFSCVAGNVIQLQGNEGANATLLLQTVTPRRISILVNVTLDTCPPGFIHGSSQECECDDEAYYGISRCDPSAFIAEIQRGVWAGYAPEDDGEPQLRTALCPIGYCTFDSVDSSEQLLPLPRDREELDPFICGPSRTGVACGSCSENYTVHFHSHSYSCKKTDLCEFGALFYILSELVPVSLLFLFIILLNVSFSSGALNGFILFSQLIGTLFVGRINTIESNSALNWLSQIHRVLYGFFNLEFFTVESLSFCLGKNFSVLDILVFKYLTIAYALILVLAVVLVMKYCGHRCRSRFVRINTIRNAVINGLSAFIIICYTQSVKISLNILLPMYLRGQEGKPYSARVWYEGDVWHFSGHHLAYAIPALIVLLFDGIPPLLLLVYPLINRVLDFCGVGESRAVVAVSQRIPMLKLKPLLDTFQSCFKDDFRFFAGLYFLYRLVGFITYASVLTITEFYAYTEIVLILMLMLHAAVRPYAKRRYNVIDSLLLANLALINALTAFGLIFNESNLYTPETVRVNITILQLILIYLPIFYFITYIVVLVIRRCRPTEDPKTRGLSAINWGFRRGTSSASAGSLDEFPARALGDMSYTPFSDSIRRRKPAESTVVENATVMDQPASPSQHSEPAATLSASQGSSAAAGTELHSTAASEAENR